MGEIIICLSEQVEKNFYAPQGLISILLIESVLLLDFLEVNYKLYLMGIIIVITTIIWFYLRRIPRTKPNKVGIVIAISTENKNEYKMIKADLIHNLSELLTNSNKKHDFQIIVYPEYYAKKVNLSSDEEIKKYGLKSKASFIIFGRSRSQRKVQGRSYIALNLRGMVFHKVVDENIHMNLEKEFTELFPSNLLIPEDNELFGFELTSQWIAMTSKYIIAIASMISWDFEYAIDLFESLMDIIKQSPNSINDVPKKIKERIPRHLIGMYHALAIHQNMEYRKYHDKQYLDLMKIYLDKIENLDENYYPHKLTKSIYFFYQGEVAAAKALIDSCSGETDSGWRYSQAFLLAYENKLSKAHSMYMKAFSAEIDQYLLLDIESFINDVLFQEPQKCQLYYCLGLINFHKKKDYFLAKNDFEMFLNNTPPNPKSSTRRKASEYLKKIEAKLSKNVA